jgi:hypothetical protein
VIGTVQVVLFLGLALVGLALEVWALVDAAGRPAQAFSWAGKRTRNFWLLLLGGAALAGFLALPPPVGFGMMPTIIMLGAVVPAAIYLSDVRPAVRGFRGGRRQPPGRGGW